MDNSVYINGHLVPLNQAHVSVQDSGFLHGYGLFETMRSYHGQVFRLDRHLERLHLASNVLDIPLDTAELARGVTRTIQANRVSSGRIRITVSAGIGVALAGKGKDFRPTTLVTATDYKPPSRAVYHRGYKATLSPVPCRNRSATSGLKTTSYLDNLLARRSAIATGADEAILRNDQGQVCEASMSNLFLVKKGRILTPPASAGILPGITRQAVIELAGGLGLDLRQTAIRPEELANMDEAFLTSSMLEIMPLTSIDGRPVGHGKPGQVTQVLAQAYSELVGRELPGGA